MISRGAVPFRTLENGEFFGEASCLGSLVASMSAVAEEESTVIKMNQLFAVYVDVFVSMYLILCLFVGVFVDMFVVSLLLYFLFIRFHLFVRLLKSNFHF